jgi:hypothetical protein
VIRSALATQLSHRMSTSSKDASVIEDHIFDPTTSSEHPHLPADFAMLPREELQMLLQQHEALMSDDAIRLEHLQWVAEMHKRDVDKAKQHLDVRSTLVLKIRAAVYRDTNEAKEVSARRPR